MLSCDATDGEVDRTVELDSEGKAVAGRTPWLNVLLLTLPRQPYETTGKRGLDVLFVLLLAPIVLPVILMIAVAVRLDGGPAFYSQLRVGQHGRHFRLWKLRSMVVDADDRLAAHLASDATARDEWDRAQKLENDPRITKVGSLIRKTSVDELPQLWNVLIGDMSLVGPRPMMLGQVDLYPGRAYYRFRPGITGFWQISRRNSSSFASRAHFDRSYGSRISLLTDIRVMLATARVVVQATGR